MYCIMQFLRKLWPIRLSSFLFMFCRIFLSFFSLSSNSSFLTRSVQLIFFILLQHHISGLPSYFWFIFRSVQFQCHTTVAYDGACSPNVSIRMAWISVSALLCRGGKNLMTARVSMLSKWRASPDMLPFSLCNKNRLAIRHMDRPLFPTTLSIQSYDIEKYVGLKTYQHPLVWCECSIDTNNAWITEL